MGLSIFLLEMKHDFSRKHACTQICLVNLNGRGAKDCFFRVEQKQRGEKGERNGREVDLVDFQLGPYVYHLHFFEEVTSDELFALQRKFQ